MIQVGLVILKDVIWPFIRKYWDFIIIFLLVLLLNWYINNLKETILEQEIEINGLEIKLANCGATLESQNKVINAWSSKTTEYMKEMEALEQVLDETNKRNKANIKNILSGYKPNTCEDAIKYLINKGQLHEHER